VYHDGLSSHLAACSLNEQTVNIEMVPEFTRQRSLIIFDFDHTIIDLNSDTWIPKELWPESDYFDLKPGSRSRKCLDEHGWTKLCNEFFGLAFE
jgi:hypothetical protein